MKLILFAAVPLLCSVATACINDRDSDALALQAGHVPKAVRVITGRFERNPPRYYEMRIAHTQKQLVAQPRNWKLYDDIGAAQDKLGHYTEALQWMDRKRAAMPRYNPRDATSRDSWYRYYANAGTFRAHRWLKGGAQPAKRAEMQHARDFIKSALQINPHAHFNREKYQLLTMEWTLRVTAPVRKVAGKPSEPKQSLADFLAEKLNWEDMYSFSFSNPPRPASRRSAAAEGLAGLIVLGAAWQSPDSFDALASALDTSEGAGVAYLAQLRAEELLKAGRHSLGGLVASDLQYMRLHSGMGPGLGVSDENRATLDKLYPQLRAEANAWSHSRDAFMNARFQQGRHPDWDPHFWDGWKPAKAPDFDVSWYSERETAKDRRAAYILRWEMAETIVTGGLLLLLAIVSLRIARNRRVRH